MTAQFRREEDTVWNHRIAGREWAKPETVRKKLVDGRRLELPTSALRTNGGSGRIWLSVQDVNGARHLNRSDAGRRVFAPVSAWSCTPVVHKLATNFGGRERAPGSGGL
jgi:hypothetical protein